MDYMTIEATTRKETGKSYAKTIRENGLLPAVMYNWKGEAISLELNASAFLKVWKKATPTTLVNLVVDGKKPLLAFIKDTEYDIITDKVLHADFHVINEKAKLRIKMNILTSGSPVGVREGGVFEKGTPSVVIECLPKDLPIRITADVSNLSVNETFYVKDLPFEKSVKILSNVEASVASVRPIRA